MSRHRFLTCCALCAVALFGSQNPLIAQDGGTVSAENVAAGKAIFEGKGACQSCHRINGNGSRVAPDLTSIGTTLSPAALAKVLVDPNGSLRPAVRSVRAVTKDGKVIIGRRLNEDMYTVQIIDEEEHLRSLTKSSLREDVILTTARMPSYQEKLSASERADVVAYLLSLKNP